MIWEKLREEEFEGALEKVTRFVQLHLVVSKCTDSTCLWVQTH